MLTPVAVPGYRWRLFDTTEEAIESPLAEMMVEYHWYGDQHIDARNDPSQKRFAQIGHVLHKYNRECAYLPNFCPPMQSIKTCLFRTCS